MLKEALDCGKVALAWGWEAGPTAPLLFGLLWMLVWLLSGLMGVGLVQVGCRSEVAGRRRQRRGGAGSKEGARQRQWLDVRLWWCR